ncbi:MAG: DUF128 domain-containing protein [Candidatus Bathyarchaeia archaeon]
MPLPLEGRPTNNDEHALRRSVEILKILEEKRGPVGARVIASELKRRGYDLNERTVRYHLRILDERGLTENLGYDGRVITQKGIEEAREALVHDRLGFIITKIESLIFKMDFDAKKGRGKIIVNLGLISEKNLDKAMSVISKVVSAGYAVSPHVKVIRPDDYAEDYVVPEGKLMIATACSITLDGLLHRVGVPASLKFGGVVQIVDRKPQRFTDAITYSGSTLDPHEVFAVKGLGSVFNAMNTGSGYVLANFREVPLEAVDCVKTCFRTAEAFGIKGVVSVGEPNNAVLGVTPSMGKIGIACYGGTNPFAALSEVGIPVETRAIHGLMQFEEMIPLQDLTIHHTSRR